MAGLAGWLSRYLDVWSRFLGVWVLLALLALGLAIATPLAANLLLVPVLISGIGAVTRSPVGVLRELAGTRKMLEQCMTEIIDVGRAHDVPFDPDVVERWMSFLDGIPADATASMQRDLMEGRPSELEAQNGAVVRLGQQVGVPTPLNDFIYNALLPMEQASRGLHPA